MHAITWLATTPTPSPTATVDPANVTPGVVGFIGTAVIAIALVLLLIDMLRRIRRAGYRSEIAEELDAEAEAAAEEDERRAHRAEASSDERGDDLSPPNPARG